MCNSKNTSDEDDYQQKLIDKLVSKPGFRGKVNAMCARCIYDPYQDGTWRSQVEQCTSVDCPLFSIRPTTTKT